MAKNAFKNDMKHIKAFKLDWSHMTASIDPKNMNSCQDFAMLTCSHAGNGRITLEV